MKVYNHTKMGAVHTLLVSPGVSHPENSDWHDDKERPRIIAVKFIDGVADVDSQLGKFLIDKKYASKSPIITLTTELAK